MGYEHSHFLQVYVVPLSSTKLNFYRSISLPVQSVNSKLEKFVVYNLIRTRGESAKGNPKFLVRRDKDNFWFVLFAFLSSTQIQKHKQHIQTACFN